MEKTLQIGQVVRFIRDSGKSGEIEISEGTIATITAIGNFRGDPYITIEKFRNERGDEILATGSDGEGYNGSWYFMDFEAIEIIE